MASRPTRETQPLLYDPLMLQVGDHEIAIEPGNLPDVIDAGKEHPLWVIIKGARVLTMVRSTSEEGTLREMRMNAGNDILSTRRPKIILYKELPDDNTLASFETCWLYVYWE